MDIESAKQQVKDTITAYLSRHDNSAYRIPFEMQRPIFLEGPPGLGKTAIVKQAAQECGINFLSYSMTHHTRQSALGLPHLVEREYEGKTYTVSEYTMSEIIASVHDSIKRTGITQGVLLLDEVNCVSETLAPAMLQFLQFKTFGQHALPHGWIVVAAGNPTEFNRAARRFDAATLDCLKSIEVEPDVDAWLDYAAQAGVHPAITSYLQCKPDRFYLVRPDAGGTRLVTARGWEDLSRMLQTCEHERLSTDEALMRQYLQLVSRDAHKTAVRPDLRIGTRPRFYLSLSTRATPMSDTAKSTSPCPSPFPAKRMSRRNHSSCSRWRKRSS